MAIFLLICGFVQCLCLLVVVYCLVDELAERHYGRWVPAGCLGKEPWFGRWCYTEIETKCPD